MTTVRLTGQPKATAGEYSEAAALHEEFHRDERLRARLLENEQIDLYAAILIMIPLALFLKFLWS
jgi:hypothetical protein